MAVKKKEENRVDNTKIIEQSAVKGYETGMAKYSIIVNRRRALPEDRDGLKPVQRKLLYDFLKEGVITFNDRVKSASIVGDTMKYFYPHGDTALYETMEPMVNPFKCKYPLIRGKGNWGTIMGDKPAAMRYTEASLSKFGYECVLSELRESDNIVDWIPSFNKKKDEPEFLPVKVPLLLVNGSFGIGVGSRMNVCIPPHNLVEVINVTRKLLKDPDTEVVLVPDHCLKCDIIEADFEKISKTGSGTYRVRGIIDIVEMNGAPALIIRSLPDRVTTEIVTSKIMEMIEHKQLPMISNVDDGSNNRGVEIIVQLKKGSDPNYVRNILYAKTKVQDTVSVNFMVVHGVDPERMSYKEYILEFINMRMMEKFRLYCDRLQKCLTRYHHLIPYIKLLESGEIDNVINMVRKQNSVDEEYLTEYLIKKLDITDLQARFILETDIRKLSKGYLDKYKEELKKLEEKQAILEKAVTDDGSIIKSEIDAELEQIAKDFGAPRTCRVVKKTDSENIPAGIFKIVITENNYIRKLPDVEKVGIIKKDNPKFILRVDNTENILLFDNMGRVFKFPVHKIPITDKSGAGTDIRLLQKNLTADIISVLYEPMIKKIAEGNIKHYIVVASKQNTIKKLDIEDFLSVNISGLIYSKVVPGDEIVDIALIPNFDVIVYSDHKALRCFANTIPLFKRNASGSKAMNTKGDIEGLSVVYPGCNNFVVITKNGIINRFLESGLSASDRGKAGSTVIKLASTDSISSIYGVSDTDIIKVTTSDGVVEIPVSSVPLYTSISKGTKMIDTKTCNIIRTDIITNR